MRAITASRVSSLARLSVTNIAMANFRPSGRVTNSLSLVAAMMPPLVPEDRFMVPLVPAARDPTQRKARWVGHPRVRVCAPPSQLHSSRKERGLNGPPCTPGHPREYSGTSAAEAGRENEVVIAALRALRHPTEPHPTEASRSPTQRKPHWVGHPPNPTQRKSR
jgi:hypothetical protein